jgi:hypothetical protein
MCASSLAIIFNEPDLHELLTFQVPNAQVITKNPSNPWPCVTFCILKSTVFCIVTPHSSERNSYISEEHDSIFRVVEEGNNKPAELIQFSLPPDSVRSLLCLLFNPKDRDRMFLRCQPISELHSIIQKATRIWGFHNGGYEEYHLLEYDAV